MEKKSFWKNMALLSFFLAPWLIHTNIPLEYSEQEEIRMEKDLEDMLNREKERVLKKRSIEESSENIEVFQNSFYKKNQERCSGYVKKSSKEHFGKEYVWDKKRKDAGAAWNLGYYNRIVYSLNNNETLRDMVVRGILHQGMLVGVYNPRSNKNNKRDIKGNKIKYSHIVEYVGVNKNKELEFVHQWGNERTGIRLEKITEKDLDKYGLFPREILDIKKQPCLLTSAEIY